MAHARTLLFLAAALIAGLFFGNRINAFLSISIIRTWAKARSP